METYRFIYPTKFIPDLKKVTSECSVDCICVPAQLPGHYEVTIMVTDAADLIDIGRIMGSNRAYDSVQQPMKEFIDIMEGKVKDFLDENPDYKPTNDFTDGL